VPVLISPTGAFFSRSCSYNPTSLLDLYFLSLTRSCPFLPRLNTPPLTYKQWRFLAPDLFPRRAPPICRIQILSPSFNLPRAVPVCFFCSHFFPCLNSESPYPGSRTNPYPYKLFIGSPPSHAEVMVYFFHPSDFFFNCFVFANPPPVNRFFRRRALLAPSVYVSVNCVPPLASPFFPSTSFCSMVSDPPVSGVSTLALFLAKIARFPPFLSPPLFSGPLRFPYPFFREPAPLGFPPRPPHGPLGPRSFFLCSPPFRFFFFFFLPPPSFC